MGAMKLCLFLFLLVAVSASLSLAASADDWTSSNGAPDFAFWGSTATTTDSRRLLFQYGYAYKDPRMKKFLSYYALKKNNAPCGYRGSSYYDCTKRQRANPYRRGCAAITGCARFTD